MKTKRQTFTLRSKRFLQINKSLPLERVNVKLSTYSKRKGISRVLDTSFVPKSISAPIGALEVKLPALSGNYEKPSLQPTDRPTDGQTGS